MTQIDPVLLEILACPEDRGPLELRRRGADQVLVNVRLGRVYRIDEGIPVLLVDEAETVGADELAEMPTESVAPPTPR